MRLVIFHVVWVTIVIVTFNFGPHVSRTVESSLWFSFKSIYTKVKIPKLVAFFYCRGYRLKKKVTPFHLKLLSASAWLVQPRIMNLEKCMELWSNGLGGRNYVHLTTLGKCIQVFSFLISSISLSISDTQRYTQILLKNMCETNIQFSNSICLLGNLRHSDAPIPSWEI